MCGNEGATVCDEGAKLREGDGATCIRAGATLRGSTRTRSGVLERGTPAHDEPEGAVRRTLSAGNV